MKTFDHEKLELYMVQLILSCGYPLSYNVEEDKSQLAMQENKSDDYCTKEDLIGDNNEKPLISSP